MKSRYTDLAVDFHGSLEGILGLFFIPFFLRLIESGWKIKGKVSCRDDLNDLVQSNLWDIVFGDVSFPSLFSSLNNSLENVGGWGIRILRSFRSRLSWLLRLRALVRTLVSTDLNCTLEVHLHWVWELECLEVCVREDWSWRAKVLDLRELGHDLRPDNTSLRVYKFNWGSFSVMSDAVSDQHVELVLFIFDGKNDGHSLTNLDNTSNFRSPWSFSDLDLHPTTDVVSCKVCPHDIQHVNWERPEGDRLFILVMPSASKFPCLIPNFLDLWVILNDDSVFKESAASSLSSIAVETILSVSSCATRVNSNVKVDGILSWIWVQVNTVSVTVVSFGEDDSVESLVKLNGDFHEVFLTLDIQVNDLRSIRSKKWPDFIDLRSWCLRLHLSLACNMTGKRDKISRNKINGEDESWRRITASTFLTGN